MPLESEDTCPVVAGFAALDPHASPEELVAGFARARDNAPVFFVPEVGWWVATRYHDIEEVVRDWETYSSEMSGRPEAQVPEQFKNDLPDGWPVYPNIAMMDPPQHTRVRKLAQGAFTTRAAGARAGDVRAVANELIDGFIAERRVDLVPEYCREIPPRVIGPIFGVAETEAQRLVQWAMESMTLVVNQHLTDEELVELARSQAQFARFVRELVADRRAQPRGEDDLLTSLVRATDEDDGSRLSDSELIMLVVGIIAAGTETSIAAIGHAIHSLLSEPDLWHAVVDDPDLIPNAVEETLRTRSPVRGIHRVTRRECVLAGVTLPAGAVLHLSLASAGRDAAVFDDPDAFDLNRPNAKQHITFAKGPHFCIGAPLARVQIRSAIQSLAERIPTLRLVPGHPLRYVSTVGNPSLLSGLVVEWD